MAHTLTVSGLNRKYARLLGERNLVQREIASIEALVTALGGHRIRLAELNRDLEAMERTIRLFRPDWTADAVAPVRPQERLPVANGYYLRTALKVLRDADRAMTAREVAFAVIDRLGIDGKRSVHSLIGVVSGAFTRYEHRLIAIERTNPRRYSLIPREQRVRTADLSASNPSTPATPAPSRRR